MRKEKVMWVWSYDKEKPMTIISKCNNTEKLETIRTGL